MASSSSSLSTSAAVYESHLTSLSLDELLAEPKALQTQAHHLTSSLTSLTHSSYSTFLSLHESTNSLSTSLSSFSDSLSSLVSKSLPALQKATSAWHTRTTDVLKDRGKARLVLEQHDRLKDLLDVPIFIDSCVRSGNFQEALQLANHVGALASRPDAPPILKSIHIEVQVAIAQMLVVLLGTLHEQGRKLPALWKAVNILRKMGVFEADASADLRNVGAPDDEEPVHGEELLALAFLSGRLSCLSANLTSMSRDITRLTRKSASEDDSADATVESLSDRDKEDVARYLKKYIDAWREGAYDIITQYSSIFLEQQTHSQPLLTVPKSNRRPSLQHTPSSPQTPSPSPSNRNLLPYLTSHLLKHIVPLLESTLPLLSLPLLPSLLTQLTYCATAFTRVGMDFRGVVSSSISSAVLAAVRRDLQAIGPILGQGRTSKAGKKPSEWLIAPSLRDNPPSIPKSQKPSPAHIPPQILVSFPPLAVYTNSLLGVLNSLRLLAPVNILDDLVTELDEVLAENGNELGGYLHLFLDSTSGKGKSPMDSNVAKAAGDVYFKVLVPFMRRALVEGVYGGKVEELKGGEEDDEDEDEDEEDERGSRRLWRIVQEWEKLGE